MQRPPTSFLTWTCKHWISINFGVGKWQIVAYAPVSRKAKKTPTSFRSLFRNMLNKIVKILLTQVHKGPCIKSPTDVMALPELRPNKY